MDSIKAFLKRLEATKGEPQAQAAIKADFHLMSYPPGEREAIRAAFDMAVILGNFNAQILGKLLSLSEHDAQRCYESLISLPFIELHHGDDCNSANVHEMTRLGYRMKMAKEQP